MTYLGTQKGQSHCHFYLSSKLNLVHIFLYCCILVYYINFCCIFVFVLLVQSQLQEGHQCQQALWCRQVINQPQKGPNIKSDGAI